MRVLYSVSENHTVKIDRGQTPVCLKRARTFKTDLRQQPTEGSAARAEGAVNGHRKAFDIPKELFF